MKKSMKPASLFRHNVCVLIVAVTAVMFAAGRTSHARSGGAGLNLLGLGIGAHIPSDSRAYGDIDADLYPELQVMFDVSGVRFGPSAGFVYREFDFIFDDFEMSFVPAKFNVAILPIRFAPMRFVFHPYLGFAFGRYFATGDNTVDLDLLAYNLGFELRFTDFYNLSFDFAYHDVERDLAYLNADLDYMTVMVVNRFRIPFWRPRR